MASDILQKRDDHLVRGRNVFMFNENIRYCKLKSDHSFRFMWFCFTGTGTVAALIIIVSLWEKFQTNPTITGMINSFLWQMKCRKQFLLAGLDTDFHNQQVIFPTINVCPTVSFNATRTWQLANVLG